MIMRIRDGSKIGSNPSLSEQDSPLITIITVVFNGEDHLEKTIMSVLNQNHNIEYIIIDGGSLDKTVGIIKKFNNEIAYWITEPDEGIYDAMNKGWRAASKNGFILFLGAGDRLISLPDENKLIHKNKVLFGKVYKGEDYPVKVAADFRLKLGNTLHHQALLIPKQLHPDPPFKTKFKTYADFDFNQRLLKQGVPFEYCDEFACYAAPGGVSKYFKIREMLMIVKTNFGYFWFFLAFLYYIYQGLRHGFGKFSLAS